MKLIGLLAFLFVAHFSFSQCTGNEPTIDLGNDTILCFGQNVALSVPPGYDFYQWSNGSTGTALTVNQAGTYWVLGGNVGTNQMVLNGDFEAGTTNTINNFTTAYVPGTGGSWGLLSTEGQYAISTSPSNVHNNFSACGDHTTGTGNMLIVNGSIIPNTNVWSQTVAVVPNQNYVFSFWAMSVVPGTSVAQLQLRINNIPISAIVSTNTTPCIWTQITGIWNSGSATSANLGIYNQATAQGGNDFAIDDIFFADNCVNRDTINVSFQYASVYAGTDKSFCPGEADSIFATTNSTVNTLVWSANGTPGSGMLPDTSGIYTVTATTPGGCTATDNVLITFKDMNWTIADIDPIQADCGLNNGATLLNIDTIDSTLPDPLPFSYIWNGPSANGPFIAQTPNISNLSPGWYYLTVTSNGCKRKDSVEITVANGPTAAATALPTSGYGPLTVSFDNLSQSATNYTWILDGNTTVNTTNTNPIDHIYTDPGVYQITLIATNGNCKDTLHLTVTVLDPPIIIVPPVLPIDSILFVGTIPNVITANGDLINDVFTFDVFGAESFTIEILNRWGNLMYSSTDPVGFGWTGEDAPDGVYFYKVTAIGFQGEERKEAGFFQILQ